MFELLITLIPAYTLEETNKKSQTLNKTLPFSFTQFELLTKTSSSSYTRRGRGPKKEKENTQQKAPPLLQLLLKKHYNRVQRTIFVARTETPARWKVGSMQSS
jgi:hypothetical protein